MNKIETLVYNAVRKNPVLKQAVRNMYQGVFDLFPRRKEFFCGTVEFREGFFFGFHDLDPLSADRKKLLSMRCPFDLRMPKLEESLEIGYFDFMDGKLGKFHVIGKSMAWNYHKGCRLQWLDNNRVIFNSSIGNDLCSKIVNVESGYEEIVEFPIDTAYSNGKREMASSFSYERLERCMPGYGYPYKDGGVISESAPDTTGLFLVDLETNKRELILSLKTIAEAVTGEIGQEYLHFVTHTEFSRNGEYLSFLYRRIPKEGDYMKRRSVVCIYRFADKKLIVLPSQESGSHYVWNGRNQIVLSCSIYGKNCHALFDMNNLDNVRLVDPEHLNSDGHQSFITDDTFVTDTYPDRFRMAKLYVADIVSGNSRMVASVYSPKKFQTKDFHCHIACDLHPRVISDGKYVCFDSPRTGKRGIYVMKLG